MRQVGQPGIQPGGETSDDFRFGPVFFKIDQGPLGANLNGANVPDQMNQTIRIVKGDKGVRHQPHKFMGQLLEKPINRRIGGVCSVAGGKLASDITIGGYYRGGSVSQPLAGGKNLWCYGGGVIVKGFCGANVPAEQALDGPVKHVLLQPAGAAEIIRHGHGFCLQGEPAF